MRFILRLFTHMTHPGVGHIQHHRKAMCFTTMAQDSKGIAVQHKEKVAQQKVASHTALASDAAWRESFAESRLPRVCGRSAASGESLAESRLPRVACRRVCGRMLRGESRLGRVAAAWRESLAESLRPGGSLALGEAKSSKQICCFFVVLCSCSSVACLK